MELKPWCEFILISILLPLALSVISNIIGGLVVAALTTSAPKKHPGANQGGYGITVITNGDIHISK